MAEASTSGSHAPEEETLAVPVGGNALNQEGEATHNPDKLGAGTPSGTPEADSPGDATTDAASSDGPLPEAATAGEGAALDNDEIEEQANTIES
jgi:hypothetical protein